MKIVTIKYQCDYCKEPIDRCSVEAIVKGRIGCEDAFIPSDKTYHYHDYCLEHLLTLEFPQEEIEEEEEAAEELEQDAEKEEGQEEPETDTLNKIHPGVKDSLAIMNLIRTGWTQKKIAEEFRVSQATMSKWVSEIRKEMAQKGVVF